MTITRSFLILGLCAGLTACGGPAEVRKQFGLKKGAPDEFAVLRRAPLEVPPPEALELPVPQPGAPRPQEVAPYKAAKKSLFGSEVTKTTDTVSEADARFLELAGSAQGDGEARSLVDAESRKLHDRNKPVVEKLFNYGGDASIPSATVVDAAAEAERIKTNLENDLPITEGETPSIEE